MPPATKLYRDTDDVKLAARNMGSHFFDADTMRFFGSRVGSNVYGGRFFVTSEQREHYTPRTYTVRVVTPSGRGRRFDITDAGGFQAFDSSAAANRAAAQLARGPFEVRHDPYEDTPAARGETAPNPRHYEWRVYVGETPIGNRTTRYSAQLMRADLERAARAAGTYGKGKR